MSSATEARLGQPPREAAFSAAIRKYVVEAVGTFFLVLTVGAAVYAAAPLAPLAIGAVLMVMIYAGGHISGGHYNPAVTLAVLIRGKIGAIDAVLYWIAQLAAGLVAALAVRGFVPRGHITAMTLSGKMGAAFVAELVFTFALCWVVLNVATSRDNEGNSFYGLAIGFTVLAGAVAVGGISGAAFNPAVALGACVLGLFAWKTIWLYLFAEAAAGVVAGLAFRTLSPADI